MKALHLSSLSLVLVLLFVLVEQSRSDSVSVEHTLKTNAAPSTAKHDKENASSATAPVCEEDVKSELVNDLIQWIKNNGGIVDDRQLVKGGELQRITAAQNVYATSFIPEGTVLLSVPWDLVVEPKDYSEHKSDWMCDMVEVLHKELEANQDGKSDFGPYMRYLESLADPIMLPTAWSEGGFDLLRQVLGDNLLPDDSEIDHDFHSWKKKCVKGTNVNGPMKKAAFLVIGYSSPNPTEKDEEWYQMIPFYDFYSPREDSTCNTFFVQDDEDEEMVVVAARDIEAGEPIYTPMAYGETADNGRQFIHSGRIERRHVFSFTDADAPFKNKKLGVKFDLDKVEENGKSFSNITWVEGVRPHSRAYDYIQTELNRMKQIASILPQDALYFLQPAEKHERKALEEYSLALIDALSALLETKHDPRPVTPWTLMDYEVAGVNLASYNLAGIEQVKEPNADEKPYELFEDFDITDQIVGNENWKDMIEYRR